MKFLRIGLLCFLSVSLTVGQPRENPHSQRTAKGETDQKKLDQFKNKYLAKNVQTSRKGKDVRMSYYDLLLEINQRDLGSESLRLYDDVTDIFSDPSNESKRLQYLGHFPKRFAEFTDIFDPPDFGELYHTSELFLLLLEDIIKDYPQRGAVLLVALAREAKYSADAPAHLQKICSIFIHDFYDDFIVEFNKLNGQDELKAVDFLADYENFDGNSVFEGIISKLEEKNNGGLLKKFLAAKEKRRARRDHDRGHASALFFSSLDSGQSL